MLTWANFAKLVDLNRMFPLYKNLVCFGDVPRGYDAFEQGDIGNGRARNPKQCEQMCSRMFKGCNAFSFDGHFCWFKKLESYTLRIVWEFSTLFMTGMRSSFSDPSSGLSTLYLKLNKVRPTKRLNFITAWTKIIQTQLSQRKKRSLQKLMCLDFIDIVLCLLK